MKEVTERHMKIMMAVKLRATMTIKMVKFLVVITTVVMLETKRKVMKQKTW